MITSSPSSRVIDSQPYSFFAMYANIDEKLLEMGAKYGDKVQIMDLIFEFKE